MICTLDDSPVDLEALKASIREHEGCRLIPYADMTGHLTIGYGRNLANGISYEEANYLMCNDIQSAIRAAEAQEWWPKVKDDDVRARAMVEILYNIGAAKFGKFAKANAALCSGDFDTAANELLQSLWHQQVGQRAETLAAMVKAGSDVV